MQDTQRVAVITGAASGIGHAIAGKLAALGHRVLMLDRSAAVDAAARRLAEQGFAAESFVVDLESAADTEDFVRAVGARHGRCDILVNNAGVHPKNKGEIFSIEEITDEAWAQVHAINLTAPFRMCRGLLPLMKAQRWGRVVNIGSRGGRTWGPVFAAHYTATKAGLLGLTRAVAGEGAGFGITANYIAPGRITTPLSNTSSAGMLAKAVESIPLRRLGTVDEVADVAVFLVSEQSAYVTGAVVDVNGGTFMG